MVEPPKKRFHAAVEEDVMDHYSKGVVPDNTKRNDSWARKTFEDGLESR